MREPMDMDEYVDLDLDQASNSRQTSRELAENLLIWAERPHPDSDLTRGRLLTLAGERLSMLGDEEAAESTLQRALASGDFDDGGLDPRCHLISLYLKQGRIDEALAMDGDLRRSRPEGITTYAFMGDVWRAHNDDRRALGWLNRALDLSERSGDYDSGAVQMLCSTRWAIRRDQGQEPDEYDELALDLQEALREGRES